MEDDLAQKYAESVAAQLRSLKGMKQISFTTLAERTGYAKSTLSGYFNGTVDVPSGRLEVIARALDTTALDILRRAERESF